MMQDFFECLGFNDLYRSNLLNFDENYKIIISGFITEIMKRLSHQRGRQSIFPNIKACGISFIKNFYREVLVWQYKI